jgi:hypothetical protein
MDWTAAGKFNRFFHALVANVANDDTPLQWEQLAYISQIAGVVIAAASLIYLTIQVRQGTEMLRSESRQASISIDQNAVYKFIEHPALGRTHSGKEPATLEEKTQLQFWIVAQMRVREYEWLQYRAGTMDEVTWSSYSGVIFFILGTKHARAMWGLRSGYFNPDFVKMVDED